MLAFFKEFAFLKASFLRNEKEVPLYLDFPRVFLFLLVSLPGVLTLRGQSGCPSQNSFLYFSHFSSPAPPVKFIFFSSSDLGVKSYPRSYPEFFLASFPDFIFLALVYIISRKVFWVCKILFLLNKSWWPKLKMELANIICKLKLNNNFFVFYSSSGNVKWLLITGWGAPRQVCLFNIFKIVSLFHQLCSKILITALLVVLCKYTCSDGTNK